MRGIIERASRRGIAATPGGNRHRRVRLETRRDPRGARDARPAPPGPRAAKPDLRLRRAARRLAAAFSGVTLLAACGPSATRPPNIVVLVADDLGWADLGVQGSPDVETPHIDSIARNGVRFTAGYVTSPQCSPSRAGLMTGRYQNRFGFEYNFKGHWDKGLDLDERTIGDSFLAAGYATGMIGKWHLGKVGALQPGQRGFTETLWHPNGGVYFPDATSGTLPGIFRGSEPAAVRLYSTDAFTDEAIDFIDRHRADPFLLYVAYATPHPPMDAKPEHLQRYAHIRDRHRRAFLAMMASLDENIGRLLGALRAAGLEEHTLVFFLSDNGGATGAPRIEPDAPIQPGRNASSNAPFRGTKVDLLEGGIRVPFLVQWKGQLPAGAVYAEPVISLDILPTALGAAGIPAPDGLDGVDLLPFLRGSRGGAPHDALYWRFDFPPAGAEPRRWAVRAGDWKLVRNSAEPLALYDLAEDPSERRNLAALHPERVAALRTRWESWNAELRPPAWPVTGAATPAR
ncbi:sulfatase-like hydrolase/transferase [Myxococcota bacterium]|nr:sulfatase-like hydrolase/transferase [Myxococcota bacterium]